MDKVQNDLLMIPTPDHEFVHCTDAESRDCASMYSHESLQGMSTQVGFTYALTQLVLLEQEEVRAHVQMGENENDQSDLESASLRAESKYDRTS
jgi:hypothetical protein